MSALSFMSGIDQAVFLAANQLVGRSWLVDGVLAMALDNPVVKAGPIGACFLYAWYAGAGARPDESRRRILLITLLAVLLVAPVTKLFSEGRQEPRPFVLADRGYSLRGGELRPSPQLPVRYLQTGELAGRADQLRRGEVTANDFDAFPSDHAAIYFAFALGILLACRIAGWFALSWAVVVVFGLRIAVGMHWLSDILVGVAVGGAVLAVLQLLAACFGRRPAGSVLNWMERRPGLAAAILFLLLIEAVGTMRTMERMRDLAGSVVEREP